MREDVCARRAGRVGAPALSGMCLRMLTSLPEPSRSRRRPARLRLKLGSAHLRLPSCTVIHQDFLDCALLAHRKGPPKACGLELGALLSLADGPVGMDEQRPPSPPRFNRACAKLAVAAHRRRTSTRAEERGWKQPILEPQRATLGQKVACRTQTLGRDARFIEPPSLLRRLLQARIRLSRAPPVALA